MDEKKTVGILLVLLLAVLMSVLIYGRLSSDSSAGDEKEPLPLVPPGYGEFNALNVVTVKSVNVSVGKEVTIRGEVIGKPFIVEGSNGSSTGYYSGKVTLKVYLGPVESKNSWSWLAGRLKPVSGIVFNITPQTFILDLNQSVPFVLRLKPEEPGDYHLYVVAIGAPGWKGWDMIELRVRYS